jgi:hypothetical protein
VTAEAPPQPGARAAEQGCDCPVDLPRRACPLWWEHAAILQAAALGKAEELNRVLIRERDAAKGDAEAAYDLAQHYAAKAGHVIGPGDVLRYVTEYWRMREGFERTADRLALFHWDILGLHRNLQVSGAGLDRLSARDLAGMVMADIEAVNPVGSVRQRPKEWFPRPDPAVLFDVNEDAS